MDGLSIRKKGFFRIIKKVYKNYQEDHVPSLSTYFTYNLLLAIFPFLIFLISVLTYTPLTSKEALEFIKDFFPSGSYYAILNTVNEVTQTNRLSFISIGMLGTIWASSNGFSSLIHGMNKAYNVEETRSFVKIRVMSIFFTLAFAILIIVYLLVVVFGDVIIKFIKDFPEFGNVFDLLAGFLQFIIPLLATFIVCFCIYYFVPNCKCSFKKILPGTIFFTVFILITSKLFSIYINNFAYLTKTYGSIGGIIILLIWLNLVSTILLVGGEINASLDIKNSKKK